MGKMTQKKQEALLIKDQEYLDVLSTKKFVRKIKDKENIREEVLIWFNSFRSLFVNYEKNNIKNFKVLSFNKHILKVALIKFMYVVYPVPQFIMNAFIDCPVGHHPSQIAKFFFDITTGKSFYKENKDIFHKKEAHFFITASNKRNINENFLWSRCKYRDIIDHYATLKKHNQIMSGLQTKRWIDFIDFIGKNKNRKINDTDIHDMIDYIARNPNITFKGRTWNSLKRLSRRWHIHGTWSNYAKEYMEWNRHGKNIDWEYFDKTTHIIWKITELLNTNELLEESKYMHHCVITYGNSCRDGRCRVFSMTCGFDFDSKFGKCITIEVNGITISQIRGKYNRKATPEEMLIVSKWAKQRNLKSN